MAFYLMPPNAAPPQIAPTCARKERGIGTEDAYVNGRTDDAANGVGTAKTINEPKNPTVLPKEALQGFHFAFLIRHPRSSIPSYYRCTIPPLDKVTGFFEFTPCEAGYSELRRLFDYLRSVGQVGPGMTDINWKSREETGDELEGHRTNGKVANGHEHANGIHHEVRICVIDADDLLDHPADVVSAFCESVGLEYRDSMLKWDTEKDEKQAKDAFAKWPGFHEDAMNSNDLKPRTHVSQSVHDPSARARALIRHFHQRKRVLSEAEEDALWQEKFGDNGARVVRETVNANIADYEYLKHFAMKL